MIIRIMVGLYPEILKIMFWKLTTKGESWILIRIQTLEEKMKVDGEHSTLGLHILVPFKLS